MRRSSPAHEDPCQLRNNADALYLASGTQTEEAGSGANVPATFFRKGTRNCVRGSRSLPDVGY
jgi:hypothetical protein